MITVTKSVIQKKWATRNDLLKIPPVDFIEGGAMAAFLRTLEKEHAEELVFTINNEGYIVTHYYSPKFLLLWEEGLKNLPHLPDGKQHMVTMEKIESWLGVDEKSSSDSHIAYDESQKFWWDLGISRVHKKSESKYVFEGFLSIAKEFRKYFASCALNKGDEFVVVCLAPDGKAFGVRGKDSRKIASRIIHFLQNFGKS